jgi:hypothetical protein
MTTPTPHQPGRPTSGHTGAGLIGSLDTGIDAGPDGQALKDRARERDTQDDGARAGDTTTAGGPGTSTPGGVSRIGSGTTGLNNYSPGSDLSAGSGIGESSGAGQLAGASGGERASAGINDPNRSSKDDDASLDG